VPITGGGNPTGGTAGVGKSLSYVRDHCYAYSGLIGVNNVETTLLEFSTGEASLLINVQYNYAESDGDDIVYRTYLNGEVVQQFITDHAKLYGWMNSFVRILIPPYSKVKCSAENLGSSSTRTQICSITGRVYR